MVKAPIVKLLMDDDGESYFEEAEVELAKTDFAPPAPPLDFAPLASFGQGFLLGGDKSWRGDTAHPTPRRQVLVVVQGAFEVTASDGDTRRLTPGSILWLEDTSGKGHKTKALEAYNLCFGVALADTD